MIGKRSEELGKRVLSTTFLLWIEKDKQTPENGTLARDKVKELIEGKLINGRSIWCKAESNPRDKPRRVSGAKGREKFTELMIAYRAAHPEAEFNNHRKADNLNIDWSEPCRLYFDDKCGSGPTLIFTWTQKSGYSIVMEHARQCVPDFNVASFIKACS